MQELLEAGVHFGHQVRRGNPRMKPYIYGVRDGVHIIDLEKSEQMLKEAAQAAYDLGKNGKVLMIVGTKKQAREIVEELAKEVDTPFLNSKWVGGLLTNFDEIKKNIKKLEGLKDEKTKGTLSRYTKKERLLIDRKLGKYESVLGGVASMDKIPDAVFLVDAVAEWTAVKEAQRMSILIFGFADTNCDPLALDYPVAANDDGIKSIKLITETVIRAYGEGKKAAGKQAIADEAKRVSDEAKKAEDEAKKEQTLDKPVAEEAAVIEEEVEKQVVQESSRKVE
jgi:small subunit ribosomal protein S2